MDLSIIIVNWNTRDITLDCIASVYKETTSYSFEVILVDNSSSDGSVEAVENKFPTVKVIKNESNLGFASANNQGIRISQGRYILLLNSDTLILDHALDRMIAWLDAHSDVGGASPRLVGRDGATQHIAGGDPTLWSYINEYLFHRFPNFYSLSAYNHDMEVGGLIGACFFVRREVCDQAGLLPEDYFMYAEDVEWCWRIRHSGWKLMYVAEPRVLHYGGESSKHAKLEMDTMLHQSRLKQFSMHHGKFQSLCLGLVMRAARVRLLLGKWKRFLFHRHYQNKMIIG